MGFLRALLRGRIREDRGVYAILFAIIIVVVFTMIAIVVDLSNVRASVRENSSNADFAALAAGSKLPGNPQAACLAAWQYIVANIPNLPPGALPPGGAGCAGFPSTPCTSATPATDYTATGTGGYVITFRYPIPDDDPAMEGRLLVSYDGTNRCERMAISVRTNQSSLFGGIVGASGLSAPATAVVRGADCQADNTCQTVSVALLLLDPYACQSLTTNGNNVQVFVHAAQPNPAATPPDPGGPGRITADSNGKATGSSCSGQKVVLSPNGSSADRIEAFPLGNDPGVIAIYAIRPPDTTCTPANKACDPAQILPNTAIIDAAGSSGPGVPTALLNRVTRSPFDHQFNCKVTYPTYNVGGGPALTLAPCTKGIPPYIDNLQTAIDGAATSPGPPPVFPNPTTVPVTGTWTTISGAACSPNAATTNIPAGNYWFNCPGPYTVGNNKTVNFLCGNAVFQNGVLVSQGTLNFNTGCGGRTTYVNPSCLTVVTGCVNDYSANAAFIYIRNGDFIVDKAGTAATILNTAVYDKYGVYQMKSGFPTLNHSAPVEGPFKNLGLWAESSSQMVLSGQSGVGLEGVFFAPQAAISYTGQGCNQQTKAQFVSRTLSVGGNGCLIMEPNPARIVPIPLIGIFLIR